MYIHEAIYETARQKALELEISDIRIGLGYTCVELNRAFCGLSYTFAKELNHASCNVLDIGEKIIGKKAIELLNGIFSYNLLDSALAIACANAILNKPQENYSDFLNLIEKEHTVVMVGYFAPIIESIKKRAKSLKIIERDPRFESLPDWASYFELKNCDIAIISATTLVNKTIDSILNFSSARYNIILGATCTMSDQVFLNTKATHLCGISVIDKDKIKTLISLAAGTRLISKYTKKECVLCRS
ncbi:Rossmann-like domain-containing protein [Desulfurella sp.]|uniref:Rossmann-like domain-containing protein n=1 Tax=Desulfurella sp. TaxID=1962857 RepID=UPI003D143CC3